MSTNLDPVAIFIPSMNRAHKLPDLIQNVHDVTPEPHKLYFMVNDDDLESQKILDDFGEFYWVDLDGQDRRFCTRIQFMYEHTDEPWFLTGADDVLFHGEWLARAWSHIEDHHNVITFNDLFNPNGTNFMIRRKYIDDVGGVIDMSPGIIYHPGYKHNYSDNELIETAAMRSCFLRLEDSIIEHLHWITGKGEYDETYQYADEMWDADKALFKERNHLWGETSLLGF